MLRKILAFFIAWVFSLFLLITVFTAAVGSTFTLSNFKNWLDKHNVYDTIVDSALSENKDLEVGSKANDISLNHPVIKKAFKKTFTPALLQEITENFINGVEPWLKGKSPNPTFRIDLTDVKTSLAANIGGAVKKRYASLPLCAPGELPRSSDLLAVNCRSAIINIDNEVQKLVSDIKNGKDFLPSPVLTADNLKVKRSGDAKAKPLFADLDEVPAIYRFIRLGPYIFGLLSVVCGVLLVFASKPRRRGLRRAAVSLLTSGLFLLIGVLIISSGFSRGEKELLAKSETNEKILRENVLPLINEVKDSLANRVIFFAVLFLALAIGIFIYLFVTRKQKTSKPELPALPDKKDTKQRGGVA